MPDIRVVSGSFCQAETVVRKLAADLGCEIVDDEAVVRETGRLFRDQDKKLWRILNGKVSAFDSFTREREIGVSRLKAVIAHVLERHNIIIWGAAAHLVPREITHVLSVCLIADLKYRVEQAMREKGIPRKEAQSLIGKEDEGPKLWTEYLFKKPPWDADLYDIVIPLNKATVDDAVQLVKEHSQSQAVRRTPASLQAVRDHQLAAAVELALGKEGHQVLVSAAAGTVSLTVNKHTLMLSRLGDDLRRIAERVPGVVAVRTRVGPDFHRSELYRQLDFDVPSRVLLVDDEKEFVQTLSERLLMRDVGTAVVYDGEQALTFVEDEAPEVIVLDLMMPGIDGVEVLRRVKRDHPEIEVIILTGHGSEADRQLCLELGAFAYLQKPVDIEKLSATMRAAYRKRRYTEVE